MTNNHPAHGPVSLDRLAQLAKRNFCQTRGEVYVPFGDEVVSMAAELQERRKAGSAEPIYQWRERYEEGSLWDDCTKVQYDGFAKKTDCEVRILYTTPPAPVVPDGCALVLRRLTAGNGAKGVLSGEFSETKFINCPECFGDDECETCDGSGRIEITVPVSWTNIKAIWAKGIEHFTSVPHKENI